MPAMPAPSGNPLQELARTLFTGLDGHPEEPISPDQFTTFLSRLVTSVIPSTTTVGVGLTASAFRPVTTTSPTMSTGPRSTMEGFDYGKIASSDQAAAKYRFARVAWRYDLSGVTNEASAEAMLKNMVPDLESAGLVPLAIDGGRLQLCDTRGDFWVDVVRWSDEGAPAFRWVEQRSSSRADSRHPVHPQG